MTPTEQDKELRRAIIGYRIKCDYYLSDRDEGVISQEEYETAISSELDSVIELITADREHVALEARIDEIEQANIVATTDQMTIRYMRGALARRITELSQNLKEYKETN